MHFSTIKIPFRQDIFHVFIIFLALLSGCTPENTAEQQIESVITFSVAGQNFMDANASIARSEVEGASPISVTTLLGDGISIVSTLTPTDKSATRSTNPIGSNVVYRVTVYDSGGNYVTHSDFTEGSPTTHSMQLISTTDAIYTFVAYSFNSTTTLPTFSSAALASAKLENVPAGTDLLYWKEARTLHSGNNVVDIVFDHKFSQINTSADATSADANIVSYSGVTFTPNYGADLTLQNGTISKKGTNTTVSLGMGTAGNQTVAAGSYANVFPAGEKPLMIHYDAIEVGNKSFVNKTVYFNETLAAGTQYTLTTKFADVKNMTVNGSGTLVGRTCIDVRQQESSGRGSFAVRNIESTTFINTLGLNTYTFTPSSAVSNVRFTWENIDGELISGIVGDNGATNISGTFTATVTFNSNLNTLASGKKRNDGALSAYIYAIYNDKADGSGTDKAVRIKVYAQDQGCCGAYTNAAKTQWISFMCHNLGADQSLYPFTPAKGLNGDYYKWGHANATGTVDGPIGMYQYLTWSSGMTWDNDPQKHFSDPCPSGYRVARKTDLDNIGGTYNLKSVIGTSPWKGINIGADLYFPFAGSLTGSTGSGSTSDSWSLSTRGTQGQYRSSTKTSDKAYVLTANGSTWSLGSAFNNVAFSVRCVAE